MTLRYTIATTMNQIDADSWRQCALDVPPFLSFEFLAALEDSGSVGGDTGWNMQAMVIYQEDELVAIVPMYAKHHSYGEYVFDHAWANAYQQHQLDYYPKLLVAVPFTPVTANKILAKKSFDGASLTEYVFKSVKQYCVAKNYSSAHLLYAASHQISIAEEMQFCQRTSVQFQWQNIGYGCFEDFLARFTSRKRKDIRKERRKVLEQDINVKVISGAQINAEDIAFFYQCYCQTYLKRSGHTGYLTRGFFEQIYATLRSNLMLVIAVQGSAPVASALYLFNEGGLYGRYWGALKEIDGLHFECCYYAGIEFAIQQGLPLFNPGTQGEHKLLRGFEPIYCKSVHHLAEPAFHAAVVNFVKQEHQATEHYFEQTSAVVPFKKTQSDKVVLPKA